MSGKLNFRYGSMSSGKSLDLLRVAYDYEAVGRKVTCMKPRTDTRGLIRGECIISSRAGLEREGYWMPDDMIDFIDLVYLLNPDILLIDEAQFLSDDQVTALRILADDGFKIIAYGLLIDFQRNMFDATKKIIEFADDIDYIPGLCECCGKKATAVVRMDEEGNPVFQGEQIDVGFHYKTVCHTCYKELEEKEIDERLEV